jgi:hypothetical protein
VTDPLNLVASNPAAPAADTVRVYANRFAGRMLPAFVGPFGVPSPLQPLLARNKVGYWCPSGNSNVVPGVLGFVAFANAGFTIAARNVATTNALTRMRRLGYVTAPSAGAVGQWRQSAAQFTLGGPSGLGGFNSYVVRFAISDAALVAVARMFMGVRSAITPSNVEPSTLTDCIGIGHGAGHTTMRLYYGGSVAQPPIDLGAGFPVDNTTPYELALSAPPNAAVARWQVTNLATGAVQSGEITGDATVLPQESTLIGPWCYRTNNTSSAAAAIDVISAYIETDN